MFFLSLQKEDLRKKYGFRLLRLTLPQLLGYLWQLLSHYSLSQSSFIETTIDKKQMIKKII